MQEFCKASAEIKLVFSGSELAELKNSEWIVFLSKEVPLADFEKLITTFNQDKPEGAILKFIAIPVAWQQFQSELKTLAKREYGRLTLKENVSHDFMIWILETPQSALVEPPIDERLVPEGPDYLRGRESWFREKFERHN